MRGAPILGRESPVRSAVLRLRFSPADAADDETRVDPADGNAYTFAEFVDAYGGTSEWDAAAPPEPGGSRAKRAHGERPDAPLVDVLMESSDLQLSGVRMEASETNISGVRMAASLLVEETEEGEAKAAAPPESQLAAGEKCLTASGVQVPASALTASGAQVPASALTASGVEEWGPKGRKREEQAAV